MKLITLYRPVGQKELDLVKASGYKKFPPRLDWQPIFYPVMNQAYAEQIALEWNTKDEISGYAGYVTAFDLPEVYLRQFPVQNVGGEIHNELWVPAEQLEFFNENIIGEIRVIKSFFGKQITMLNKIKAAFFGLAIGDALGVPVEFKSRDYLETFPVKTMTGFGSWNQTPGTWSDDSSLAFCLAESLTKGYDLNDIAQNFINWKQKGFWGAHHKVFDIGGATRFAIDRLSGGTAPAVSGGMLEEDNGNGSLMRIMPLLFEIKDLPIDERYQMVKAVSAITHAHFRSVFSCFIYLEMALQVLQNKELNDAYDSMKKTVKLFIAENDFSQKELRLFNRILDSNIKDLSPTAVRSSGYVLHTLEAAIWCVLNTSNYVDAVLKAVNLGEDTDTTGCVTGGLAGLIYGIEAIPEIWINETARKDDIADLCNRLFNKLEK